MKKTVVLLSILAFALPLHAQHAQSGYGNFTWASPAEISVGSDSNFLVDRVTPDQKLLVNSLPASVLLAAPDLRPSRLSDRVYLIKAPTLAYLADTRRNHLSFSYQPEFEIFQTNHDQNSWNSDLIMDYNHWFSRRWQFAIGDSYRSSNDPSRTLQNPLLLLPRSRFQENGLRTGITFDQSARTGYTLRYDHVSATFGDYDPLQRAILDTISQQGSFIVSHMLRRNHRLRVTYSVFSVKPWNHQKKEDERVDTTFADFRKPAQSLAGDYRFTLNPKTVIEFSGGGIRTTTGMNYSLGVSSERRVGQVWFGAAYSRGLSLQSAPQANFANGLSSSSYYEVLNFHLRGEPIRKVGVQFGISGSRTVDGLVLNTNKSMMERARIDYRLSDRMVAFITQESYYQNRNDYVGTALDRSRLFVGFDYSLSRESDRRISRVNRDAENVAITDQGRKRVKPQQ